MRTSEVPAKLVLQLVCGSTWLGVAAVKAEQMTSGASYGPEALKAIG